MQWPPYAIVSSRLHAGILIGLLGCVQTEPVPESMSLPEARPLERVSTVASDTFGGAVPGRSYWLSGNGRLAAILRFVEDTDRNGIIETLFGYHGDLLGDHPQLWVYDLEQGSAERWDELLTIDATARRIVLRRDDRIVMLDAETGAQLDLSTLGLAARADANDCLPPPFVDFDPDGARIAFFRGDPPELVVRDLATGRESTTRPRDGLLWRAFFMSEPGWLMLFEVDPPEPGDSTDLPQLRTTCACAMCTLFASSWSFLGWSDTTFRRTLVTPMRLRVPTEFEQVTPVGTETYVVGDTSLIFRVDGRAVPLPEGCDQAGAVPRAPMVFLKCGEAMRLFDPVSRREVRLRLPVDPLDAPAVRDSAGMYWVAVLATPDSLQNQPRNRPAKYALGRLRIEDGLIEMGPVVQSAEMVTSGWVLGTRSDAAYALDLRTGVLWHTPLDGIRYDSGFLISQETGPAIHLLPRRGRFAQVPDGHGARSNTGCWLEPTTGGRQVERGPWLRRCVEGAF